MWAYGDPANGDADPAKPLAIGMITNNPNGLRNIDGFRQGLTELGYEDGKNATFLDTGKPVPRAELGAAIEDMVARGADILFTAGTPTGVAANTATKESGVPVIFGVVADPVAAGIMTDLSAPGGNMTGVMLSQNQARRLELLHEILPQVRRVLLPYNPDDAAPVSAAAQLDDAASALGLTLVHRHARSDDEVSALLADIPPDIDAVFMLPDSTVNRHVDELIAVANARSLPVSGPSYAQIEDGALMAYGIMHREVGLQAARIADRILRGADPRITPVEVADFYLTINLAAARRLGIDLSEGDLQQANFIVRKDRIAQ
ncbi:MAG: ABC transporter substrate-binding protein [Paracoccaceae bacterium]|nr:ABC transporter substrate-binding protein [Paracoccaceae bacterium]